MLSGLPQPTLYYRRDQKIWLANRSAQKLLGTENMHQIGADLPPELSEATPETGAVEMSFERLGMILTAASSEFCGGRLITLRRESLTQVNMAAVSHSIHMMITPLVTALQGLQTALDSQPEPAPEAERFYAIANHSFYRLRRLADDLDLGAAFADDAAVLHPVPVNMMEFCARIGQKAAPLLKTLGLELRVETGPPVYTMADTDKLERALLNLLAAAGKASAAPAEIHLYARVKEDRLLLTVRDHGGAGEDPGRESLFRLPELQEYDNILSGGGLALGLYTVRAVAQLHGGCVLAVRENGMSVTMSLPIRPVKQTELREREMVYDPTGGFAREMIHLSELLPSPVYGRHHTKA